MDSESRPWCHRPAHVFLPGATYMVTGGTLHKVPLFNDKIRLSMLSDALFEVARAHDWQLQAWAIFPNHYHFIAQAVSEALSLQRMIQHLHSQTARRINALDGAPGRRVWFQYWDTCLTFEKSYLARLNYVHNNPVKHGIVRSAELYPFCSAGWFNTHADSSFWRKVESFGYERVNVPDDY